MLQNKEQLAVEMLQDRIAADHQCIDTEFLGCPHCGSHDEHPAWCRWEEYVKLVKGGEVTGGWDVKENSIQER